MEDENKTKLMPFKFPLWFRKQLDEAKVTEKHGKRTVAEIVITSVCKAEKFKKPKGLKFRKPA